MNIGSVSRLWAQLRTKLRPISFCKTRTKPMSNKVQNQSLRFLVSSIFQFWAILVFYFNFIGPLFHFNFHILFLGPNQEALCKSTTMWCCDLLRRQGWCDCCDMPTDEVLLRCDSTLTARLLQGE